MDTSLLGKLWAIRNLLSDPAQPRCHWKHIIKHCLLHVTAELLGPFSSAVDRQSYEILLSNFFVFPLIHQFSYCLSYFSLSSALSLRLRSSHLSAVQRWSSQSLKPAFGIGDKIGYRGDATSEISLSHLPGRKIISCQNLTE